MRSKSTTNVVIVNHARYSVGGPPTLLPVERSRLAVFSAVYARPSCLGGFCGTERVPLPPPRSDLVGWLPFASLLIPSHSTQGPSSPHFSSHFPFSIFPFPLLHP